MSRQLPGRDAVEAIEGPLTELTVEAIEGPLSSHAIERAHARGCATSASTTAETSSAPASWSISLCGAVTGVHLGPCFILLHRWPGLKSLVSSPSRSSLALEERSWGALRAVCAWWRVKFRVAVLSRPHANDHCCAWLHRLVTVASPVLHRSNKPE